MSKLFFKNYFTSKQSGCKDSFFFKRLEGTMVAIGTAQR
jgi:hypothetical protein